MPSDDASARESGLADRPRPPLRALALFGESFEFLRAHPGPAIPLIVASAVLGVGTEEYLGQFENARQSIDWHAIGLEALVVGAIVSAFYAWMYFVFLRVCIDRARGRSGWHGLRISPWALIRVSTVQILIMIPILLGIFMLLLPGLFLGARWWLLWPIVADRGGSAWAALRQSWRATEDHVWPLVRFFALFMLIAMPIGGITTAIDAAAEATLGEGAQWVVGFLVALFTSAISAIQWTAPVILYRHLIPDPDAGTASVPADVA